MSNLIINLNIKHKGRLTRPWDISYLLIKMYGFFFLQVKQNIIRNFEDFFHLLHQQSFFTDFHEHIQFILHSIHSCTQEHPHKKYQNPFPVKLPIINLFLVTFSQNGSLLLANSKVLRNKDIFFINHLSNSNKKIFKIKFVTDMKYG